MSCTSRTSLLLLCVLLEIGIRDAFGCYGDDCLEQMKADHVDMIKSAIMKEMNWDGLPDMTVTDEQRVQALMDYEKEHGPVPPHWKLANADDESFILPTGYECDEDPKQSCCVENFYIDFGEQHLTGFSYQNFFVMQQLRNGKKPVFMCRPKKYKPLKMIIIEDGKTSVITIDGIVDKCECSY
ncbi:hypothetical protein WR25_08085 [Diploscapter pachys]|uniref:TGF-beta family profile domain-containing protein n=1 Tax=Diploscapter pachys TaxID=2018661 RepID=A0A2A2L1Y1_9BILA|nr:hypothetical protein WR25_08085 [Diploscapter pachys]